MEFRVHYLVQFALLVLPGLVAKRAVLANVAECLMYGVHDAYLLDTGCCDYGGYIIA